MKSYRFRVLPGDSVVLPDAILKLIRQLEPAIDEMPTPVVLVALGTLLATVSRLVTSDESSARKMAAAVLVAGFGHDAAQKEREKAQSEA